MKIQVCNSAKTVRICLGAGCKAWGSEHILSLVQENMRRFPKFEDYQLLAEGCMNKCGGGASIDMDGRLFKARDMEKAVNILFQEQLSDTAV